MGELWWRGGMLYIGERFLYFPFLYLDMAEATLDDRGRLTLPKEIRERYGDHYYIVELGDGVKLVPVEDDPLAALQDEFADIDKPAAQLHKEAREEALDRAGR